MNIEKIEGGYTQKDANLGPYSQHFIIFFVTYELDH